MIVLIASAIVFSICSAQLQKQDSNGPSPNPNNPWDLKWWNRVVGNMNDKQEPEVDERWLKRQANINEAVLDPEAMKVAAKQAELQSLLQQIYQAEAAVKMETGEVTRTQQVALEAEQALEEATNKVRMLSADLQTAQEAAAQAAIRAHTAQLQLSAHDQLMFTARQKVDALSAQMVSVQADLASAQQYFTLNNSSQHLEQQAHGYQMPSIQTDPDALLAIAPDAMGPLQTSAYYPGSDLSLQGKYMWPSNNAGGSSMNIDPNKRQNSYFNALPGN